MPVSENMFPYQRWYKSGLGLDTGQLAGTKTPVPVPVPGNSLPVQVYRGFTTRADPWRRIIKERRVSTYSAIRTPVNATCSAHTNSKSLMSKFLRLVFLRQVQKDCMADRALHFIARQMVITYSELTVPNP
jgi:hypothetical protein